MTANPVPTSDSGMTLEGIGRVLMDAMTTCLTIMIIRRDRDDDIST